MNSTTFGRLAVQFALIEELAPRSNCGEVRALLGEDLVLPGPGEEPVTDSLVGHGVGFALNHRAALELSPKVEPLDLQAKPGRSFGNRFFLENTLRHEPSDRSLEPLDQLTGSRFLHQVVARPDGDERLRVLAPVDTNVRRAKCRLHRAVLHPGTCWFLQ